MAHEVFENFPKSTIAGTVSDSATEINVAPGTGLRFPNPSLGDFFRTVAIKSSTGVKEVMVIDGRNGDSLQVRTRGAEGTSPLALEDGDLIQQSAMATSMAQMAGEVDIQNSAARYAVTTGTNAKVGNLSESPQAYREGMYLIAQGGGPNTGPANINFNGVGAAAIKKWINGQVQDLGNEDMRVPYMLAFIGGQFILETPSLRSAYELNQGVADGNLPSGADVKNNVRTFSKQQAQPGVSISSVAGTLEWDLSVNVNAFTTLTENINVIELDSPRQGMSYSIRMTQDNPGGWTVVFPSNVLWPDGGAPPAFTTDVGAIDLVVLRYFSPNFYAIRIPDYQ